MPISPVSGDVPDANHPQADPQFIEAMAAARAVRDHFGLLRDHVQRLTHAVTGAQVYLGHTSKLGQEYGRELGPVLDFLTFVEGTVSDVERHRVDAAIDAVYAPDRHSSVELESER